MRDDLFELKERVKFASESSEILGNDIREYLSKSVKYWGEDWDGATAINAEITQDVPISIRSRSGMIVNELRSVLDALAYRLAQRNGHARSKTYFPISKNEEIFKTDGMEKIKKLSDVDQKKIINLQPFFGGHPYLFLLHEADRVKKHQNLLAFSGKGALSVTGSGYVGTMISGNEDGIIKKVGEVVTIGVYKNVSMGIKLDFNVIYNEPDLLAGHSVIGLLAVFCPMVFEIILLFE